MCMKNILFCKKRRVISAPQLTAKPIDIFVFAA